MNKFVLSKEAFLLKFEEKRDVRNAKRKALSQGYDVEVDGRGSKALYWLSITPPEGYHYYKTIEEVKIITGQDRVDRALKRFKNGHNCLKGMFVWYKQGRSIMELEPEDRIRYAFEVNPLLADGYTYQSLGRMIGMDGRSVRYYLFKIMKEDGVEPPLFKDVYRTGFVRDGHVYCLDKEDSLRLIQTYGPRYYDGNEEVIRTFFSHGFTLSQYREKVIRAENVGQLKKYNADEYYEFLVPEKSLSEQERLNYLVRDLWRFSKRGGAIQLGFSLQPAIYRVYS